MAEKKVAIEVGTTHVLEQSFVDADCEAKTRTVIDLVKAPLEFPHFSLALLADYDFRETAKTSIHTKTQDLTNNFFRALCCLDDGDQIVFDASCRKIFEKLVGFVGKETRSNPKGKKKRTQHEYLILTYLQSNDFQRLIDHPKNKKLCDRKGMVKVVLTLAVWFWDRVREGMSKMALVGASICSDAEESDEFDARDEVNRFSAWAVKEVFEQYRAKVDDFYIDKEDDDLDAEDEGQQAELRLRFIKTMRTFHEDVLFNEKYMAECYSPQYQVFNMGYLTLVSEQYFPFGAAVARAAAESLTQSHIRDEGNNHLEKAWACLEEKKPMLRKLFLECGKDDFPGIDKAMKEAIMQKLIEKTVNARFGMAEKNFSSRTVKRGGTNHRRGAFRSKLAVKSSGSEVDKKLLQTIDES